MTLESSLRICPDSRAVYSGRGGARVRAAAVRTYSLATFQGHCFTTMPSASSRYLSSLSDSLMLNRRHALGLLAASSFLNPRASADVAPQRNEIRDGLTRHFIEAGTA